MPRFAWVCTPTSKCRSVEQIYLAAKRGRISFLNPEAGHLAYVQSGPLALGRSRAFICHMLAWPLGRCAELNHDNCSWALDLANNLPMYCTGLCYAWRGFVAPGPRVWLCALVFLVLKLSQNSGGGFCSMSLPAEWLLDESAGLAMRNDSGVSSCWPLCQKTS